MLVSWYFDWIWDYKGREEAYIPRLKLFDHVFTTDGDCQEDYERNGITRHLLRQAIDPEVIRPVEPVEEYRCDVGFIGHAYTHERRVMLDELGKRFGFHLFGANNEHRGEEHARACASVKVMVGDSYRSDLPGYWSNRVYLHLGSGAFVLHARTPGMEDHFTDGIHLVYYDGIGSLLNKVEKYLGLSEEREQIAETGCRLVHARDTWDLRVKELLRICGWD